MKKKHIAIGVISLIGLFALNIGWNSVAPVLNQYGLQVGAANELTRETSTADYAQRQYEWFTQQRQDIEAMQRKIENQRTQIKDFKETRNISDLSYSEQQQYNRMTNRLLGYRNQYETYVADYNARMNQSYRAQYNNSLPLEMEDKFWTGDLIP